VDYALIAGLLEVGIIVPIVVCAVHAHTIAGWGDDSVDRMCGEGHGAILQHTAAPGKRSSFKVLVTGAPDRSCRIG
jgi:hypothetical protein